MDQAVVSLFDRLAGFGPWFFFAGFVLMLYRREVWAMLTNSRDHLSPLMQQMTDLFEKNLEYFDKTSRGVEAMNAELTKQTLLLNEIVRELVRRQQ